MFSAPASPARRADGSLDRRCDAPLRSFLPSTGPSTAGPSNALGPRAGPNVSRMSSPARMPSRRARRAIAPGKVYLRSTLRRLGVSERRLASDEFTRVLPGCHTFAAEPAPLLEIARIAQEHVVPGSVISHISAAEVLSLPLPFRMTWDRGAPLHVDVEAAQRRSAGHRLIVHTRGARRRLTLPSGLVVADPLDVLLDLAGLLPHDELVACIDALGSLRRSDIRVPVETVRVAARSMTGRHVRALRLAARDARDAVDSPRETATRLLLMRRGFPEPETNRPVVDPATGVEYFLDLSYDRWKIAIEYDGKDHFDPERVKRDRYKDEVLHDQGWSVLRLTSHDHRDPGNFLARLRAKIRDASRHAA